jgi:flagellar protein FlaJ
MSGSSEEYLLDGPNPEYGLAQLRRESPISEDEKARMRAEYGHVRTYFKLHPERYAKVQRSLNQGRFGVTYDEYLARTLVFTVVASVVGSVLGGLLAYVLADVGVLATVQNPLDVRGGFVNWVGANRTLFAVFALTFLGGGLVAASVWFGRYYYPTVVVSSRRQSIDVTLPHAIVYMYALSHGGMGLHEVMTSLANSRDTYGEVANEFEAIVNDIELFGTDLYTALQNARNTTPSRNMEQFLDDLLAALDSGGDVTAFFEEEADTYLREAEEAQEDFLETLAMLAEVFVVAFVAAPLFLIVVLVVISIMGGSTLSQLSLLVYLVLPVAMVAFLVVVDVLGEPFEQPDAKLTHGALKEDAVTAADLADDERFTPYDRNALRVRVEDLLRDPTGVLLDQPFTSLVLTVPLAVGAVVAMGLTGLVEPSVDALMARPVATTTALFVVPLLVVLTPLTVFYELKRRREIEIARRFPDTLNILSSANKMGIPLVDGLDLVSRWSEGVVAKELRVVRNDIEWNHDVTGALLKFGDRIRVPQLSRTMKLLAEGIRSSGDLSRVLSIAAEDTRNREKLERTRRRELGSYIAVVVIGFLVFLLVIVLLDASFLTPLSGLEDTNPAPAGADVPIGFSSVPVETYRLMFFHAALVQALGSGLLAGKLSDNDTMSGLKYGLALVLVAMAAFAFV